MIPPDIPSKPHLTFETVCELLADAQRRALLRYFTDQDTDVAKLDELVKHVHEHVDDVTSPDQARLTLTHMHVPKLAEYGVLEYDQRSTTVRYRESRQVDALLEVAATYE